MNLVVAIGFSSYNSCSIAQQPYTVAMYTYDSIIDQNYGSAIDYAGNSVELTMDIYKPMNSFCNRPIAILVHGGAWVAGTKEDPDMVYLSRYLVKRGYIVANVNYRLGTHKAASYNMYWACNTSISAPCAYISDSAEVIRANYRAMQDVKGAIRYMKSRYVQDSSDYTNVFLVGQSAGGFISLSTAFTNDPSEKPIACGAINDAPFYDSDMLTFGCVPNPISFARPDLGNVEGDMHIGTFDASVQGVGNFFGGLLDTSIVDISELSNLATYLFHQGSDVVVHYNYGPLLGRTSNECFGQANICQPYYFYPFAWGSKGLNAHFQSLVGSLSNYQADIVENYQFQNDCFDNGHSIDAIVLRADNMLSVFSDKIAANGNQPSSLCNIGMDEIFHSDAKLFPNPVDKLFTIHVQETGIYRIYTPEGKIVSKGKVRSPEELLDVSFLEDGVYFILLENSRSTGRFVVKH